MTDQAIFRIVHTLLDVWCEPDVVFDRVFGDSSRAVWLDNADGSGYSVLADDTGPQAFALAAALGPAQGDSNAASDVRAILDAIEATLAQHRTALERSHTVERDGPACACPCGVGWLGWLGYECGAALVGVAAHTAPTPDAALIFADRAVIIDHARQTIHVQELRPDPDPFAANLWANWVRASLIDDVGDRMNRGTHPPTGLPPATGRRWPSGGWDVARRDYLEEISEVQRSIGRGDVYQVCLTNEFRAVFDGDPLTAYRALRLAQPTPRSAFVRFDDTSVLCASPEQFLRVEPDDGGAIATVRPIKGTRPRAAGSADARSANDLVTNEKERAENLMIVDLMRNDLSRVAVPGSVEVGALFDVETYASVHQLVSSVSCRLAPGVGAAALLTALLPGGSMTGAPKQSAMSIIDRLEARPRGIYSGVIGSFAIDGSIDLTMVIRTAVIQGAQITIGAGGGVTADSVPDAEWDEVVLKARSVATSLGVEVDPGFDGDRVT